MTKNDIITEIYNSNLFEKMASTYNSKLGYYKEDWIQHMYLVACEIPEEKLIDMYNKGELNYYLFYIGKASCFNPNSDFNKTHIGRLDIAFSLDDENYKEKGYNDYED